MVSSRAYSDAWIGDFSSWPFIEPVRDREQESIGFGTPRVVICIYMAGTIGDLEREWDSFTERCVLMP